jgi:hypothetical protein
MLQVALTQLPAVAVGSHCAVVGSAGFTAHSFHAPQSTLLHAVAGSSMQRSNDGTKFCG